MEKWYKNELTIMTFGVVMPLMNLYETFIVEDEKIFLGNWMPKDKTEIPAEVGVNLSLANIEIERTPMGLLMQVRANFYSYGDVAVKWLDFIHKMYPSLDFYLRYKDIDLTQMGEVYTQGPPDENGNISDRAKITHTENEIQWYNLDNKTLMDRLEYYSIQKTKLF